jgi:hypothetical protein
MRYREPARTKMTTAPERNIKVEDAWPPTATSAATELLFELLEAFEHLFRFKAAFDKRNGIGKIASSAAVGRIEDDLRSVKKTELRVQACNRRFNDFAWRTVSSVPSVGSDRNRIEVRCTRHG